MSENTKIEWADSSWSPWRGCTKVSSGCANCYAETLSKRNPAVLGQWGKGKPRVLAKNWNDPVKWNRKEGSTKVSHAEFVSARRPRVFPSLCDWLDDEVPAELRARFLKLTHDTPNLDWLLLTKRPENWAVQMDTLRRMTGATFECAQRVASEWCSGCTPPNVWIGTSVEDQSNADRRIPQLLKIPARLRFLSVEPMLGPVDLGFPSGASTAVKFPDDFATWSAARRDQWFKDTARATYIARCEIGIDWVIVGGESGLGSRPCNVNWIRDVVRQCSAANVPCFVKQLGSNAVTPTGIDGHSQTYGTCHPKGGDPAEWPEDLRVRQMPEVKP